ncbi:hypothetical protein HAX54_025379, partial [Datura stramonium]|nr:hypothetical protein [Datura stramonium]
EIYVKAEDYQLWLITLKGPLVPTKVKSKGTKALMNTTVSLDAPVQRRFGTLSLWLMK